jgi:hypothetical protein
LASLSTAIKNPIYSILFSCIFQHDPCPLHLCHCLCHCRCSYFKIMSSQQNCDSKHSIYRGTRNYSTPKKMILQWMIQWLIQSWFNIS